MEWSASADTQRVITYGRVSTDDQSLGLDAQQTALQERCAREGWTIVGEYKDEGVSGSLAPTKRPELSQAITALHAGEADALVIGKLDRLSRDVRHFAELSHQAHLSQRRKHSWRIVVLDLAIDITTPYGEFMSCMLVATAQLERALISERTKNALAEYKRQGGTLGRPRQLASDTRNLITDAYQEGNTPYAIAKQLNGDAVPTAQGGARWHESTVRAILTAEGLLS